MHNYSWFVVLTMFHASLPTYDVLSCTHYTLVQSLVCTKALHTALYVVSHGRRLRSESHSESKEGNCKYIFHSSSYKVVISNKPQSLLDVVHISSNAQHRVSLSHWNYKIIKILHVPKYYVHINRVDSFKASIVIKTVVVMIWLCTYSKF